MYYGGNEKIRTTSTGVSVTGQLTVTNGIEMTAGNFNAGDGERIRLGNSADLQIYHDGSNSYIKDNGIGDLRFMASNIKFYDNATAELMAQMIPNGAVELYYNNSKKLETTSTGVEISDTVTASKGRFTSTGDASVGSTAHAFQTGVRRTPTGPLMIFRRSWGRTISISS